MIYLLYVSLALCVFLSVGQIVVVLAFVRAFQNRHRSTPTQDYQPKTAVVLALRGPDPYLTDCLHGLMAQDYPDYSLFVVVDHADDPVLVDLNAFCAEHDPEKRIEISVLESPNEMCSLKCSSLIQVIQTLDDQFEVVALLDGDVNPHPTWLTDLVRPLQDEKVGVTTGNRWYVPSGLGWGAWIRYCWNVGAVVQVWMNEITWAGSMALRRSTIEKVGLLDAWRSALSVDATVHRQIKAHGLRVKFTPTVMMVNREQISTDRFIRWVQRQLMAAKSCGGGWTWVGLHALNLAFTQLLAIGLAIAGLILNRMDIAGLAAGGLILYWGSAMLAVWLTESVIRKTVADNGESVIWSGWRDGLRALWAMIMVQAVYPYALSVAIFKNRVFWRGIEYKISGVRNVKMIEYRPYSETEPIQSAESVI